MIGPSARPWMNWSTKALPLSSIWPTGPCQMILPSIEHGDPVGDLAHARHVVGDRERGGARAAGRSRTISSLITSAMIGSSPVVGSSKKRISGWVAMARARPTRFCMPPDSSAGDRSATSAARPTWPRISTARCRGLAPDPAACLAAGRRRRSPRPAGCRTAPRPGTACRTCARTCSQRSARRRRSPPRRRSGSSRSSGSQDAEDALDQHRLAGARAADHHQRLARRPRSRSTPSQHLLGAEALGTGPRIRDLWAAWRLAHRLKNSSVTT